MNGHRHSGNNSGAEQAYVHALKYARLNSLYDPLLRLTMRESLFKGRLVEQMNLEKGQRVLDVGCGTATLTLLLKKTHPDAEVTGIDGDPGILEIARKKTAKAGLQIAFDEGMAYALPYADGSFDRVVSSLMLHHLTRENKQRALREAWRVLRPGGELHVADFAKPHTALMRLIALPALLGASSMVRDNLQGRLPDLIRSAGFEEVCERQRFQTIFGTLSLFSAIKMGAPPAARVALEEKRP